jgi:hypothetical protein
MDGTILRSQVFKLLHSGDSFDMVWITADRRRGTGGDLISAEGWMVVEQVKSEKLKVKSADAPAFGNGGPSRDPNHPENGTVNVYNPANSGVHPHKVHIDLIQFFNGKRVIN